MKRYFPCILHLFGMSPRTLSVPTFVHGNMRTPRLMVRFCSVPHFLILIHHRQLFIELKVRHVQSQVKDRALHYNQIAKYQVRFPPSVWYDFFLFPNIFPIIAGGQHCRLALALVLPVIIRKLKGGVDREFPSCNTGKARDR